MIDKPSKGRNNNFHDNTNPNINLNLQTKLDSCFIDFGIA